MALLTEKYPKSIQGKTYSALKITPKVYLVHYAFQTSFICVTLFCSHTIHSPLEEKRQSHERCDLIISLTLYL